MEGSNSASKDNFVNSSYMDKEKTFLKEKNSMVRSNKDDDSLFLLYFAISWEGHEEMCAGDSSDIFKDGFLPDSPTETEESESNSQQDDLLSTHCSSKDGECNFPQNHSTKFNNIKSELQFDSLAPASFSSSQHRLSVDNSILPTAFVQQDPEQELSALSCQQTTRQSSHKIQPSIQSNSFSNFYKEFMEKTKVIKNDHQQEPAETQVIQLDALPYCHESMMISENLPFPPKGMDEIATERERNLENTFVKPHERIFKKVLFLFAQSPKKTKKEELNCNVCNIHFTRKSALIRHLKRIHLQMDTSYMLLGRACQICKMTFKKTSDWRSHLDTVHSIRAFPCNECGKAFKTNRDLKGHKLTHSSDRPFSCEVCERRFKKRSILKSHMFVHTQKSKHICEHCGNHYQSNSYLQFHIKLRHTGERIKCYICDKGFVTQYKLKEHMVIHSDERPMKCSICNKGFKTQQGLKRHTDTHNDNRIKRFSCDLCGKMFEKQSQVTYHRRVHLEKQFKCKDCEKEFVYESKFIEHQAIHKSEKPFRCEECGKCFARIKTFKMHIVDHSNGKTFKCEQCGKGFKRNDHLKKHMLSHSDHKPFECEVCKKTFNRKYNLKVHSKVHTDEYMKKVADRKSSKNKKRARENFDEESASSEDEDLKEEITFSDNEDLDEERLKKDRSTSTKIKEGDVDEEGINNIQDEDKNGKEKKKSENENVGEQINGSMDVCAQRVKRSSRRKSTVNYKEITEDDIDFSVL